MVYRCRNDPNWTMEFVSRACLPLTGYAPEELLGNTTVAYAELIVPEDQQQVWDKVQQAVERRETFQLDYRIRTKGGVLKHVWEQGCGVFCPNTGELLALEGYINDVSRFKELESKALSAARMEAVGRLAGGVAHDFNNLLCVIIGGAELMRATTELSEPQKLEIDQIGEAAERAAALTAQLLAYSRRQVLQNAPTDLSRVVVGLEPLLRRLIGEDIRMRVLVPERPCVIFGDVSQLEQVVMNLVVNARDAMPDGGDLTVTVSTSDVPPSLPEAAPGAYVRLTVADTGQGMPPEVATRVFEPFFSTKEAGRGSGLGLATSYGIVKQTGGHALVESEVGLGTTFHLHFPAHAGAEELRRPSPIQVAAAPRGETVLLVEDEELVRAVLQRVLEHAGYSVLTANDGDAAKAMLEESARIDVLLSDIVLPKVNGLTLVQEARKLRPELPAVLMSGYARGSALRKDLSGGVRFLQKPVRPDRLLSELRAALDEPG